MADRYLIRDPLTVDGLPPKESSLKKIQRNEQLVQQQQEAVEQEKQIAERERLRLEESKKKYAEEYKKVFDELKAARQQAEAAGGFYKMPDPKVIFCIRLHGINKLAPKPKKILQLFRLRQIHNGVFIKVNKATENMLRQIAPFVTFGYPSLATIRKLILKRGYGKAGVSKMTCKCSRVRLTEALIYQKLSQYGIHNSEDLIHEIYTCGPHFKQATNFLYPFKLTAPRGGFVKKVRGFCHPCGGDWGNREDLINQLVNRML